MKKKIHLLLAVSFLLYCSGCATNETQDNPPDSIGTLEQSDIEDAQYYSVRTNVYDNGLLYTNNGKSYLLDYNSMEGIPLCNKPNCSHSAPSCTAVQCGSSALSIIHDEYVYYFTANNKIVDAEDGLSQTMEVTGKLHRASLTTGEITVVTDTQGLDMSAITSAAVINNELYVIGSYCAVQANDGKWVYYPSGGKQYLCGINLLDGTLTNYGLVNDSPYAENSIVKEGNSVFSFNDSVQIDGIYDGKLYMHYSYVMESQELLGRIDGSVQEDQINWHYEVKAFDPTMKEFSTSDLPPAELIAENNYIYQNDAGSYVIRNAQGVEITATGMEADYPLILTYVNGKLWSDGVNRCFDTDTQTIKTYQEKYVDTCAMILDYTGEQYIVQYFADTGSLAYDMVSENNLIH